MNSVGYFDIISGGNEKQGIGNWREGSPCYNMSKKKWADLYLCSHVLEKVELISNEMGYLAEETSKQNFEGVAWFLLTFYSKM